MSLNVFYRTFIAAKMSAETAGVVGLKIAETLPAGRGSPHGCGLRAVIYRDVTSARPDSLTASVEGTAQRRFWLAGARGYRGRRRWAAISCGARKYPPRWPLLPYQPGRLLQSQISLIATLVNRLMLRRAEIGLIHPGKPLHRLRQRRANPAGDGAQNR